MDRYEEVETWPEIIIRLFNEHRFLVGLIAGLCLQRVFFYIIFGIYIVTFFIRLAI